MFLAGDAAHTLSPATGQGMNCGMQDAANLAWKLALVHKQQGRPPILLDSYASERCPAADALLNVTNPATPHVQELSMLCTPLRLGSATTCYASSRRSGSFSAESRAA